MRRVNTSAAAGRRSGGGSAGGGAGKGASSSSRRGAPRPSSSSPPKPADRRPLTSSKPKPKPPQQSGGDSKAKPPPSSSSAASSAAATATAAKKKKKKKPASPPPPPSSSSSPQQSPAETHKTFDEAVITVRAGSGGRGEISKPGSGTWVRNFKFKAGDGKSSRQIFLPSAEPARGGDGGSVLLRADPSVPDLLHLRYEYANAGGGGGNKSDAEGLRFTARDGRAGDAAAGSNAPRAPGQAKRLEAAAAAAAAADSSGFFDSSRGGGPDAPPLVIRVPLGTVVKRARGGGRGQRGDGGGGALVGELLTPGQTLVVAGGGRGGAGVVAPRKGAAAAARARAAAAEARRQRRLSGDGGASFDAFAVAAAAAGASGASTENSPLSDPNASFLALEEEADALYEAGADELLEDDGSWKLDARGQPGEGPWKLRLLLRVVADVGLVGAPNAGKSSMLAALTRARPEVAAYPFTTLRPNLGVLAAPLPVGKKGKKKRVGGGGGGEEGGSDEEDEDSEEQQQQTTSFVFGGFEEEEEEEEGAAALEEEEEQLEIDEEFAFGGRRRARGGAAGGGKEIARDPLKRGAAGAPRPVLADLPGLIEGAASGRGLGRAFLRHLRRARVILHVVDASTADPVSDYAAIRKELALYNPDYLSRPHVVALNKADLFFFPPSSSSSSSPSSSSSSSSSSSPGDAADGERKNENKNNAKIDLGASPPLPELAGQIRRAAAVVFEEAVLGQREGEGDDDDDDDDSEGEEQEEEEGEERRPASAAAAVAAKTAALAASLPHSVVWTSADSDLGLEALRGALSSALASTAGQPAPGGAQRAPSQRARLRKERRAAALAEFEASESRRGRDYAAEELEW